MAVVLIANYAKRLGLPGYSSHQFSVSVETELSNVENIAEESERLYRQLQEAVDGQIQQTGFVPPDGYGLDPKQAKVNGHGANGVNGHNASINGSNGHSADSAHRAAASAPEEPWNCTEGQENLIRQLVHDHKLDKKQVEEKAMTLFGIGVKQLNKMQASQLIEGLLEQTGKKQNGSRWRNSGNRQPQGGRA